MFVIGRENYVSKKGDVRGLVYLGEPVACGYRPVTRYIIKDDDAFDSSLDDLGLGSEVGVEFGSFNGQLFIKNIYKKG